MLHDNIPGVKGPRSKLRLNLNYYSPYCSPIDGEFTTAEMLVERCLKRDSVLSHF